jgi:choice-of-anchor B domain-containing protein
MKKLLLLCFLFSTSLIYSQSIFNMTLLGQKNEFTTGGIPSGWHYASCWGYTAPNGREYAIIGHYEGTTVYDITNVNNITNKGTIPGPGSFYNYREMKTYSHYLYIVAEGGAGVQIVDLQYLPDSLHFVKSFTYSGFTRAHSISQTGSYLYLNGGNNTPGGGLTILDLTIDPGNPVKRGSWTTGYVHDSYVRNDTVFAACISSSPPNLSVLNAVNKDNITTVTSWTYPGAVTHNAWTTEDGKYLVTTDEGGSNHAKIWDINDIFNPIQLADINPYELSMVHNSYIKGDSLYLAHYRAGVIVYDISNRSNPVEVGHYDTYPGTGTAYQGCWNIYPFFESGKIVASDISTGLYVLQMGPSVSVNDPVSITPESYKLSQNYPNPFNPSTKIKFAIPNSQFTTLKVFNSLGREIAILVNEKLNAGEYEVDFNSELHSKEKITSGVYFYRLDAGTFSETKKMLLLQ